MVRVHRNGLMVQSILVNGRMTKPMEKEHLCMSVVTNTKVNGRKVSNMAKESTLKLTEEVTMEIGNSICSMARELRLQMVVHMKVPFIRVRKKEMVI